MSKMIDIETLIQKTLKNQWVVDVLEEQSGNWTQEHFKKGVAYYQVYNHLIWFATRVVRLAYNKEIDKPNVENVGWKAKFADESEKVVFCAGLESEIEKFINETNFPKSVDESRGLIKYSLFKIARYTTQVSLMIAFDLDPNLLVMSKEEIFESQMKLVKAFAKSGKPVILAVVQK